MKCDVEGVAEFKMAALKCTKDKLSDSKLQSNLM